MYTDEAPYEVLYTKDLSFGELQSLKIIEELVEKYYNPRIEHSLSYLLREGRSPFAFFNVFAAKLFEAGFLWCEHSLLSRFRILLESFGEGNPDLRPWLLYDFRCHARRQAPPHWLGGPRNPKPKSELINSGRLGELIPEAAGLSPRELERWTIVEELPFKEGTQIVLFYYTSDGMRARTERME